MLIFFLVALAASVAGAICGIGGGVIIKPVLDLLHLETVTTISFLSGCTVLSMSCYSVGKSLLAREHSVSLKTGTPLALGAAVGGLAGNQLFAAVRELSGSPDTVGAVQAACLAVVTAGTLLYTVNKARIPTRHVQNFAACVVIGLALGAMSSFLGIGGGPFNVAVLYYFFSMPAKKAAQNSLFIVLFSQLTSTLRTVLFDSVPPFPWAILLGMVLLSIAGSEAGRRINKTIDNRQATLWLEGAMVLVMGISIYNIIKFLG